MLYAEIRDRAPEQFRRLTGVFPETFEQMLKTLHRATSKYGRPSKLSMADQLLLTLLYWREYRTQYHMAADFGISEPTCSRIIRRVEDILSRSRRFKLPSKKQLQASDMVFEVIIVDATESPIQRPKKTKKRTTAAKSVVTR